MAPEVSAGTSVEALGGKEKIETPRTREFEPGGVLLPGLTSEALWDAQSPFRSGIGWHMLIVVLEMIGFICKVSSNLVWMLRQAWEALQASVAATPRVTESDPWGEAGCSRDGTTNLQRRVVHACDRARRDVLAGTKAVNWPEDNGISRMLCSENPTSHAQKHGLDDVEPPPSGSSCDRSSRN